MKNANSINQFDLYYTKSDGNNESICVIVDSKDLSIYNSSDEENITWGTSIPLKYAGELRDFLDYALKDSS